MNLAPKSVDVRIYRTPYPVVRKMSALDKPLLTANVFYGQSLMIQFLTSLTSSATEQLKFL